MIPEHIWVTGDDPSIVHRALIGSGGTGDVHEVFFLFRIIIGMVLMIDT
jgi:hypothetical protein